MIAPRAPADPDRHAVRIAWALWAGLALVSLIRALLGGKHAGIYHVFSEAGRAWIEGHALYTPGQSLDVFRCAPLIAVLLVPMSLTPEAIGSGLLRLANIAVYAWGVLSLARAIVPRPTRGHIALLMILALPLAFQALGDVQTTGLTAGLLAWGTALILRGRALPASLCATLAAMVKAYPVALLMLWIADRPRRALAPALIALTLLAALPWFMQSPGYVLEQHRGWVHDALGARAGTGTVSPFLDIRVPLRLAGVDLSPGAYLALEVIGGGLIAALMLACRRRGAPAPDRLVAMLALGTLWMTVLGPASESQTYVLAGPGAAVMMLGVLTRRRVDVVAVLGVSGFVLLSATQFGLWFPGGRQLGGWGLHSLGGGLMMLAIAHALWHRYPILGPGGSDASTAPSGQRRGGA